MNQTLRCLVGLTLFLTPLLFWTLTPNFFATPKQFFLLLSVLGILGYWLVSSLKSSTLRLPHAGLAYLLCFFVLAVLLNLSFIPEGRTEAIISRGLLYISGSLLALFLSSSPTPTLKRFALTGLVGGAALLSLHSILQLTVLHSLPSLPTFMNTKSFTPAGTPLTALSFILIGLTASISWAFGTKHLSRRVLLLVGTALMTIASVAYLSLMIDGRELTPLNLPLTASWSIALDALKGGRNLLLGVGLANFSSYYGTVKPLVLNNGIFWNAIPNSSGTELLQILTTGGLLLTIPFVLMLLFPLRRLALNSASTLNRTIALSLIVSILFLVFTPATVPLLTVFFALLGLSASASPRTVPLSPAGRLPLTLAFLSLAAIMLFYSGKIVLAESHFRRAQLALTANDSETVYQAHLKAIQYLPSLTNYHLSYSQINLNLASALSQKTSPTEEDRNTITQLLSQSVREARLATTLRPNLANTWVNLGYVYRNLINVADGAEQLALENYTQAVRLDPANPSLRVELGGVYYQLAQTLSAQEDPDSAQLARTYLVQAIEQFRVATNLKSNYANAWYNLSKAYEAAGEFQLSYQAMQQVLASLDPNSPDLDTATAELQTLKSQLPSPTPSPASTESPSTIDHQPSVISEPSPLPSSLPGGPIDLEEEPDLSSPTPEPTPAPVLN